MGGGVIIRYLHNSDGLIVKTGFTIKDVGSNTVLATVGGNSSQEVKIPITDISVVDNGFAGKTRKISIAVNNNLSDPIIHNISNNGCWHYINL